jgi:uncharacterized peroxidase-related enzyme
MALIDLVEREQASPEVAAMFDLVAAEYGFVPNILRAMAHCPDLLTTFVPFWGQVYHSPTIGARLRALAALGTAKAQECTYCMAHMTASARKAGLAAQEINAVGDRATESQTFTNQETLILSLADVLTRDPDGIGDKLRADIRAEFSDAEIVNIVLAIGMYNLTSRFLKALAVDVEDVFATALYATPTIG